jgi:hypothetical protein
VTARWQRLAGAAGSWWRVFVLSVVKEVLRGRRYPERSGGGDAGVRG